MRLHRLARSLPVTAVALAAFCNGCALPQVNPRLAHDFASGATRVRTVAVLPVDLSVQIGGQSPRSAQSVELDQKMLDRVHRGLGAALARRGYQVTALLEPNGASVDPRGGGWRLLIHPKDLLALRLEIHRNTSLFAPGPGLIETRVAADLTRTLGQTTGADASLYARGWAYVAPGDSGGATAAKVILGILIVLVIVGVVLALVASKGKGGGSGLGHLFGAGRAVAHVAAGVGQVMIRTAPYVVAAAVDAHHRDQYVHCYTCPPPPPPPPPVVEIDGPEPWEGNTVEEPVPAPPVAPPAPRSPSVAPIRPPPPPTLTLRSGPAPRGHEVGLAISLVHNPTGRVLWHAGQRFAVKARGEADVDRLVEHFLEKLPPAR